MTLYHWYDNQEIKMWITKDNPFDLHMDKKSYSIIIQRDREEASRKARLVWAPSWETLRCALAKFGEILSFKRRTIPS